MRVSVTKLGGEGREFDLAAAGEEVRDAARHALEGELTVLAGVLRFTSERQRVEVRGHVDASARRACERCGEPLELRVRGEVALSYLPEEGSLLGGERELDSEDLDVGWYRGQDLSLEDVVSEAIALLLPALVCCEDSQACSERTKDLLAQYGRSGEEGGLSGLGALVIKG